MGSTGHSALDIDMTDDISAFGATGKAKARTGGGGGSSTPSVTVERPPESVLEFLMAAVRAGDGVAEYPVLASNAAQVADLIEATDNEDVIRLLDSLEGDGVETVSLEDFFGADLEGEGVEFVGTPPLLNEKDRGEFSDLDDEIQDRYQDEDIYSYGDPDNGLKAYIVEPEWLDIVREDRIDDAIINNVNYALNGHWYPEVREATEGDEPTRFKVQIGRNHNHTDEDGNVDEMAKRRHVAFTFEQSETTDQRVLSAAHNVGNISEEDVEAYQDGELDLDDIADLIRENRD